MSLHSNLTLHISCAMSDHIGDAGLTKYDLNDLQPQLSQIHQGLSDLRRLGQLPFQDLPKHEDVLERVVRKGSEIQENYKTIILLGIGGSSLGATFLKKSLCKRSSVELIICDSLDTEEWQSIAERVDFSQTLLMVISKSGKTIETWASLLFFYEKLRENISEESLNSHILIITDPQEGSLRAFAENKKIETFEVPSGVGGRYSVLTPVGLLPAACLGIDVRELLAGANHMSERCQNENPWFNPALMSAAISYLFETKKKRTIRILMPYGERLRNYAPWFSQLWAESLGKKLSLKGEIVHRGIALISAIGPQDQHSQLQLYLEGPEDKLITFIVSESVPHDIFLKSKFDSLEGDLALLPGKTVHELSMIERMATAEALRAQGRPHQTILLSAVDEHSIGQLIMMAELETVYAGALYNINPFDQPAVELIKKNIHSYLSDGYESQQERAFII